MKKKIIIASVCAVAVILSGMIGYRLGISNSAPASTIQKIDTGSVYVPGYDFISMKAGETTIPAKLYNPEGNSCLIKAAIILPDGTEIFRSDMLNPGDTLDKIKLSKTVAAGTYEKTILRYFCYAPGDLRQLNGADVLFTLEVKP